MRESEGVHPLKSISVFARIYPIREVEISETNNTKYIRADSLMEFCSYILYSYYVGISCHKWVAYYAIVTLLLQSAAQH